MPHHTHRRTLRVLATIPLAVAALVAGGGAAAQAHDEGPTLTSLTATEQRNQLALQQVLAQNAPADEEHVAEHAQLATAEQRFAALPQSRKTAIQAGAASAARAAAAAGDATTPADAATVGAWTTAPFPAPTYALNMVMLPTGKVLVFSMGGNNASCQQKCRPQDHGNAGFNTNNDGAAAVWDPTKGTGADAFRILPPPNVDLTGYDLTAVRSDPVVVEGNKAFPAFDQGAEKLRPAPIFCSGQVQTADGRVLIAGGNLEARGNAYGLKMSFLFDPFTEQWTREPDLQHARWYPTLTRTASGRVAILGGRNEKGKDVASIEMYPEQGAAVPGVDGAASGTSGLATSSLFDDPTDLANPLGDKTGGNGSTYSDALGYYPFSQVLPDGDLAISRWQTGRIGLLGSAAAGTGAGSSSAFRYLGNTTYKSALGKYATAFPAPGDENGTPEMIMAGGLNIKPDYSPGADPLSSVWSIRPSESAAANGPDWASQPALHVPRRFAGATLLPDGSAVIVGGGDENDRIPIADIEHPEQHEQRHLELWDPVTREWTLGPAQVVPRAYHSTSMLLPDGRVLSGGDDWVSYVLDADHTDQFDSTFEIYSPPYLFKGARPQIDDLPARIEFGGSFAVKGSTTDGHRITRATLVAPGSVTHAYDDNQRVLELPLQGAGDGAFRITAPTSGNAAPPGDYMLFLIDERGVPSVGRFVRVASEHAANVPVDEPTTTPGTTPVPGGGDSTPGTGATPPGGSEGSGGTAPGASEGSGTASGGTTGGSTAPAGPLSPVPGGSPTIVTPVPALTPSSTTTPKPAAPAAKPVPAVRLSGRTLKIALTLTPTRKSCPKVVTATATASGRKTVKRLTVKPVTTAGKRTCRVTTTMTLGAKPKSSKVTVKVAFKGTGLRPRTVTAQRA